MVKRRKKPKNTFYVDYVIRKGKCYGIFETLDGRVHYKEFFETDKQVVSDYKETEHYLILTK